MTDFENNIWCFVCNFEGNMISNWYLVFYKVFIIDEFASTKTCSWLLDVVDELSRVISTYRCVVVFGRSDAISPSLSPIEVHFTVTRSFSNKHVQFPASKHKITELFSLLPGLLKLSCSLSCSEVAEMIVAHRAKTWIPQNIIRCCDLWGFNPCPNGSQRSL